MRKYASTAITGPVQSFPIAIIVSQFNQKITKPLKDGALEHLRTRGFAEEDIILIEVPGALEIPDMARFVATHTKVEAIVALGSIVFGETTHYSWVVPHVSQGCQKVAVDCNIPVIFGVLGTEHEAQAWDALGGKFGHKGVNSVNDAIAMHNIRSQIITSNSK